MTKKEKFVQQVFDEKEFYVSGEYRKELEKNSGGFWNYFKKDFLLIMIALGVWMIAYFQYTSYNSFFCYKGSCEQRVYR